MFGFCWFDRFEGGRRRQYADTWHSCWGEQEGDDKSCEKKKMVQPRKLRLVVTLGTSRLDAPSRAVQVVLATACLSTNRTHRWPTTCRHAPPPTRPVPTGRSPDMYKRRKHRHGQRQPHQDGRHRQLFDSSSHMWRHHGWPSLPWVVVMDWKPGPVRRHPLSWDPAHGEEIPQARWRSGQDCRDNDVRGAPPGGIDTVTGACFDAFTYRLTLLFGVFSARYQPLPTSTAVDDLSLPLLQDNIPKRSKLTRSNLTVSRAWLLRQ